MELTYSEAAKQSGEQYAQLQQASALLEEVLGEDAATVTARWDRTEDEQGRPLFLLRLSDAHGEVVGRFESSEFQAKYYLMSRLYQLFGNLLRIQTKKYVQAIKERVG